MLFDLLPSSSHGTQSPVPVLSHSYAAAESRPNSIYVCWWVGSEWLSRAGSAASPAIRWQTWPTRPYASWSANSALQTTSLTKQYHKRAVAGMAFAYPASGGAILQLSNTRVIPRATPQFLAALPPRLRDTLVIANEKILNTLVIATP